MEVYSYHKLPGYLVNRVDFNSKFLFAMCQSKSNFREYKLIIFKLKTQYSDFASQKHKSTKRTQKYSKNISTVLQIGPKLGQNSLLKRALQENTQLNKDKNNISPSKIFKLCGTIDLTWAKFNSFPRFLISPMYKDEHGLKVTDLVLTGDAKSPLEFYKISRLGLKLKSKNVEDLKFLKLAVTGFESTEQFDLSKLHPQYKERVTDKKMPFWWYIFLNIFPILLGSCFAIIYCTYWRQKSKMNFETIEGEIEFVEARYGTIGVYDTLNTLHRATE